MPAIVVVGANWGDEGKGKVIDFLAEEVDFVVRYCGGHNAGHTVKNHLGDFAMGASPAECQAFFGRLNGTKHLVRGNHDKPRVLDLPWASQHDLVQTTVDGTRLVLCHYAMRSWPGAWRGALHLFGHTHGTLPPTRQSCDVGVDAWAYRPVTLGEIRERLAGVDEEPEEIRLARAMEAEGE